MPRNALLTKEAVTAAGMAIVRREGQNALTARALSRELGCSLSPIFTVFKDMDEIQVSVKKAAEDFFADFMKDVNEFEPAFKEFGLRLVRFAKQDGNLFDMLFLSRGGRSDIAGQIAQRSLMDIQQNYDLNDSQASMIFKQMWPVATGIASLCVHRPMAFSEEETGQILSNHFSGMMWLIKSGQQVINIVPKRRSPDESSGKLAE